ncbi:MAG: hypothetical protein IIA02_15970 [Proteobacteria bacterium]|uniref:hypothetical protein n=1 Tax=Aquabacterium sp. TaxID=1872578 RepID=UPI0035C7379F|nr:hypothetical protein [Pseudomonadota bacterium]
MADHGNDSRVAVLVDCDNTSPDILEHALQVVAQFGRVVMRRGYGNHSTLANKWQEALSDMVRCYPELALTQGQNNGFWVSLKPAA